MSELPNLMSAAPEALYFTAPVVFYALFSWLWRREAMVARVITPDKAVIGYRPVVGRLQWRAGTYQTTDIRDAVEYRREDIEKFIAELRADLRIPQSKKLRVEYQ